MVEERSPLTVVLDPGPYSNRGFVSGPGFHVLLQPCERPPAGFVGRRFLAALNPKVTALPRLIFSLAWTFVQYVYDRGSRSLTSESDTVSGTA